MPRSSDRAGVAPPPSLPLKKGEGIVLGRDHAVRSRSGPMRVAKSTACSPSRARRAPPRTRRWPAQQQLAAGAVLPCSAHTVRNDILGEAQQSIREHVRVDPRVSEHRGWMDLHLRPALLDIDGARNAIDRLHLSVRASVSALTRRARSSTASGAVPSCSCGRGTGVPWRWRHARKCDRSEADSSRVWLETRIDVCWHERLGCANGHQPSSPRTRGSRRA